MLNTEPILFNNSSSIEAAAEKHEKMRRELLRADEKEMEKEEKSENQLRNCIIEA